MDEKRIPAFCKYCGKPILPNADFCPSCGKPLTQKGMQQYTQQAVAANQQRPTEKVYQPTINVATSTVATFSLGSALEVAGSAFVILGLFFPWGTHMVEYSSEYGHWGSYTEWLSVFHHASGLQLAFLAIVTAVASVGNVLFKVYHRNCWLSAGVLILFIGTILITLGPISEGIEEAELKQCGGLFFSVVAVALICAGIWQTNRENKSLSKIGSFSFNHILTRNGFALLLAVTFILPIFSLLQTAPHLYLTICAIAQIAFIFITLTSREVTTANIVQTWAVSAFVYYIYYSFGYCSFVYRPGLVEWDTLSTYHQLTYLIGLLCGEFLPMLLLSMAIQKKQYRYISLAVTLLYCGAYLIYNMIDCINLEGLAFALPIVALVVAVVLAILMLRSIKVKDNDSSAARFSDPLLLALVALYVMISVVHFIMRLNGSANYEEDGILKPTAAYVLLLILHCLCLLAVPAAITEKKKRIVAFSLIAPLYIWNILTQISNL